ICVLETASVPSGSIGNIFDETKGANGTFNKENLNALAQKAGFNNLASMIKYIEDGGEPKNAVDFGHSTVKFGKSFGGEGENAEEYVWIPAYLSQSSADNNGDGTGDVVLTLWLAYNRHTSPYHESYSGDNVQPSSNNYSTSITRTEVLNNTGVYYTGYNNGDKTPNLKAVNYTATDEKTHEFQMYTTGVLKDYIVEPSNISWQTGTGSNRMKNDPGWKGNTNGYYFQDKAGNPQTWVNDKLWLPSIYEMYDGSVKVNSTVEAVELKTTAGVANVNAAGLWGTNANERKCTGNTYTRTARQNNYKHVYCVGATGSGEFTIISANTYKCAVRPALHLNLSMIGSCQHNLVNHPAVSYCDKEGYEEYWQCTECDSMFSDSEGANAIDEPVKADPAGHAYSDEWITNATNHWHVCGNNCGIKGSDGSHSGGTATCQQKATCEVCGQTYGSLGDHDLEHHDGKTPTCTEKGWNAYDTCKLCDYTTYSEIGAKGHTPSAWKEDKAATCTEAGSRHKECTVCNTTLETGTIDKIAHSPGDWKEDKAPTCTAKGTKHKECTVCHATLESGTIDKLAHTPGDAATCTTAQTCTVCGTEIAPKLGHKYEAVEGGGKPPTCTEDGNGKVKCSRCGDEKVGDSIPATGHTPGIAATCTEPQICTECQTELAAALGHDWGEWETTKEATEEEEGEKQRECQRDGCEEKETQPIPKLDHVHVEVVDEAVAPTCT
ncbi:MAG: hypothetical protein K2O67_02320, partial [Clostridia bacterium]|nr:hypothetical protein [Clostridia bacterium]